MDLDERDEVIEVLRLVTLDPPHRCSVCMGFSPSWDGHSVHPPCVGYARQRAAELLRKMEG